MAQQGAGKRAGNRRGPKKRTLPTRPVLLLSLAITVCVVAWGYLVLAAIDFGSNARGGESAAWGFLALACLGAAACLFTGMILVGRLLRATGIITEPALPVDDAHAVAATADAQFSTTNGTARGVAAGSVPIGREMERVRVVPAPRRQGGKRAAR